MEPGQLTLTVVTPERAVVEGVACDSVRLPTERGEIGILPGHTPLVALLGVGVVTWKDGKTQGSVAVRNGFVEVGSDAVRVLADLAASPETVDASAAAAERGDAERRRGQVVGDEQLDAVNEDAVWAESRLALVSSAPPRSR
ncbi:MAG: ATP synthase F1 subunit epsilon [Acidobacteria bacterium]|nr:MAG: ATP synthase F1 subunit epsilon [Acidobacteriota bacterium]